MPFSKQKTLEIKAALGTKLASGELNAWEKSFLENMSKRFKAYGPATKLSDKQYKTLFRLIHLKPGEQNVVPFTQVPIKSKLATSKARVIRNHTKSRPNNYRPRRRISRFERKLTRSSMIYVVIFGLLALASMFGSGDNVPSNSRSISYGTLSGRVTHVRDGDTIVVSNTPIRFEKLDCAELGTSAGERAKRRMQALAGGKQVTCHLIGRRSYDRQIGECSLSDGRNLSRVMVQEDYCSWWR